jgi:hypothetical protein
MVYQIACGNDTSGSSPQFMVSQAPNGFNDCFGLCDNYTPSATETYYTTCNAFVYVGKSNGVGAGNCYLASMSASLSSSSFSSSSSSSVSSSLSSSSSSSVSSSSSSSVSSVLSSSANVPFSCNSTVTVSVPWTPPAGMKF